MSRRKNLPLSRMRDILAGDLWAQLRTLGRYDSPPCEATIETSLRLEQPLGVLELEWLRIHVRDTVSTLNETTYHLSWGDSWLTVPDHGSSSVYVDFKVTDLARLAKKAPATT